MNIYINYEINCTGKCDTCTKNTCENSPQNTQQLDEAYCYADELYA